MYAQNVDNTDNTDNMNEKKNYQPSSFGDNCKLWLKEKEPEDRFFYLEIGFYGDCGGSRTLYKGKFESRERIGCTELAGSVPRS